MTESVPPELPHHIGILNDASHIAPNAPDATLTLVGDGADHDGFVELARELGVANRTFFPGECSAQMFISRSASLSRWTVSHSLAYLAGFLRKPAIVNRHNRRAPLWDEADRAAMDFDLPVGGA